MDTSCGCGSSCSTACVTACSNMCGSSCQGTSTIGGMTRINRVTIPQIKKNTINNEEIISYQNKGGAINGR